MLARSRQLFERLHGGRVLHVRLRSACCAQGQGQHARKPKMVRRTDATAQKLVRVDQVDADAAVPSALPPARDDTSDGISKRRRQQAATPPVAPTAASVGAAAQVWSYVFSALQTPARLAEANGCRIATKARACGGACRCALGTCAAAPAGSLPVAGGVRVQKELHVECAAHVVATRCAMLHAAASAFCLLCGRRHWSALRCSLSGAWQSWARPP